MTTMWQYQVGQRALGRLMQVIEDPSSADAPYDTHPLQGLPGSERPVTD